MELAPVFMAKWVGGGLGPHEVRAWPGWAAGDVLLSMRVEAENR